MARGAAMARKAKAEKARASKIRAHVERTQVDQAIVRVLAAAEAVAASCGGSLDGLEAPQAVLLTECWRLQNAWDKQKQ